MKSSKILTLGPLLARLDRARKQGKKIVFTNGCFDILHIGHVRYLKKAKALGNLLVVGVNADSSVRQLKGPTRPLHSQKIRAEVLGALEAVDFVTVFSEATPIKLIQAIRPDVLVKGGDWKVKDIVGSDWVLAWGGKVRSLPFVQGHSTTGLLKRLLES